MVCRRVSVSSVKKILTGSSSKTALFFYPNIIIFVALVPWTRARSWKTMYGKLISIVPMFNSTKLNSFILFIQDELDQSYIKEILRYLSDNLITLE